MKARARKGVPGPLTPDRVAAAALAFMDEHGLEALTVRGLGASMGVEGMALYRHFPSKAAILDAVAELLILELVVTPSGEGWKARALQVGRDYRAISRRHPRAFPLLGMRRFATPRSLALLDRIFFALLSSGLTARQAVEVYRGVANWANGTILDELAGLESAKANGPREVPGELTALKAVQPWLGTNHFDEIFESGLLALLDGLESKFASKGRRR
jgi:AcrR family transcriptional regulator